MDGKSLTPEQEKLQALQQILPEAFTEGKIDWEKLKATLGENINFAHERYVLNWAGKSEAFKVLQTPTTKTLIPAKDESIDFDTTQNIFIEGENLEVLKVLQKSYFGKVKMIYIDPPYNTGNDSFIYPDKFSETKAEYEKRVGDKDEDGYMTKDGMFKKNSKENGQYHSNWLNMMMPRLYLAKNLLKQDGVIFVSIDDNEVHNLRLLMNEIFGEENFVASIVWEKRYGRSNDAKLMSTVTEHLLLFRKNEYLNVLREPRSEKTNEDYSNPDNDPRGKWTSVSFVSQRTRDERQNLGYEITNPYTGKVYSHPTNSWKYNEQKFLEMVADNRFYWGKKNDQDFPRIKRFLAELPEGMVPINLWKHSETGTTDEGTKEVLELIGKNIFTFPKPKRLIQRMVQMATAEDDIILDFFSGSGTTGHAIMDLNRETLGNRKFICVQLPELCEEKGEAYKAGYKTIADVSKYRIRKASLKLQEEIKLEIKKTEGKIQKLQGELPTEETKTEIETLKTKIEQLKNQDLGFKVLKLDESNFKQWQQLEGKDAQALEDQMKLFIDPVAAHATTENMAYELLLKSGKDLNSTLIKQEGYYTVNDKELVLLLENATQEIIDAVITIKPKKVIALDKLFKGNDQLKTNTVLQMRDAGIEFKTI
ncbi:DNA methyltransferase [Flavobacterium sp. NG2]|uniref:site-specific DNA-methyltransferase n=1 Tax=Flavobacterium sp. NG2 TaxID=3097547 RepID=UPI002A81C9A6|nr:DNA methyltransferase [Flavobacterium sp. NG2]WPR71981.1 DNA methyltransferase [Flavobacterium sp. NG2]